MKAKSRKRASVKALGCRLNQYEALAMEGKLKNAGYEIVDFGEEAELGVVIGKTCSQVSEEEATDHIFGYTCFNDVTALSLLDADPTFQQWVRAKGFDSFGVFGPVIDTQVDPDGLTIRAELNGRERQNYPVNELFYSPRELVSHISKNMTLLPGDIIACGTGPGALPMKSGMTIDVIIDPIGRLSNPFQ